MAHAARSHAGTSKRDGARSKEQLTFWLGPSSFPASFLRFLNRRSDGKLAQRRPVGWCRQEKYAAAGAVAGKGKKVMRHRQSPGPGGWYGFGGR